MTIRSVARALQLLEALNRRGSASVKQLQGDTGLPKPTIVRMLQTFVTEGYVANDPLTSGYSVTSRVETLSSGFHGNPSIVEAARPWAIALTEEWHWPVGVAVLDRSGIRIRLSTIPNTSMSPFHSTLNMRFSLFFSALGLAYLAFCPEEERLSLVSMADEDERRLLNGREPDWLDWRIEVAKRRGYAERDPATEPRDSATVAVPIMAGDRVAATMGVTYFRKGLSEADKQKLVASLTRAAAETGQGGVPAR